MSVGDADVYAGDDFYCDVALADLESFEVVHDGPGVVAFHHTRPYWEVHVVVVPKRHVPSLTSLGDADEPLVRELLTVVTEVAARMEHEHGAARVVSNVGSYQDSKHLHFHVGYGARRGG